MFRDKEEALARLEEELLEEELEEEEEDLEDAEEEEAEDYLEEPSGDTSDYKNFANDYGKTVKAYNADTADLDLDAYSEDVYTSTGSRRSGIWVVLLLLLTGIFLVLGWWVIRYLGVL